MYGNLYSYRAIITSVYDGDTCTATIDLGFGLSKVKVKLRLAGINAPEIRGGTKKSKIIARASRDYLKELILNKEVILRTEKDKKGKYGRYIATIWVKLNDGSYQCANDLLLIKGHAVKRNY